MRWAVALLWGAVGCDGVGLAIGSGPPLDATSSAAPTSSVTETGSATDSGSESGDGLDRDGDGVPADVDCHDFHNRIYPDAPEVFDGFDNDCDGAIDEDGANEPAFEGFGRNARGGAGGTVVRVTSLADEGPGSLRDAIDGVAGPTIIEFDVAGEIELQSPLIIDQPFVTINGASAAAPGITVRTVDDGVTRLQIGGTHDVILSHLRFVGTHDPAPVEPGLQTTVAVDGDTGPDRVARDIVIDHVTVIRSTGGGPDLWGDVSGVTLSHCLVLEGLSATSITYDGPDPFVIDGVSVHHNVFVGNHRHTPQLNGETRSIDIVNNVMVNWGGLSGETSGALLVKLTDGAPPVSANIVANHMASDRDRAWAIVFGTQPGPSDGDGGPQTPPEDGAVVESDALGSLWLAGNRLPAETLDRFSTVPEPLPIPIDDQVQTWDANELAAATLPWAGVRDRTAAEQAHVDTAAASF